MALHVYGRIIEQTSSLTQSSSVTVSLFCVRSFPRSRYNRCSKLRGKKISRHFKRKPNYSYIAVTLSPFCLSVSLAINVGIVYTLEGSIYRSIQPDSLFKASKSNTSSFPAAVFYGKQGFPLVPIAITKAVLV